MHRITEFTVTLNVVLQTNIINSYYVINLSQLLLETSITKLNTCNRKDTKLQIIAFEDNQIFFYDLFRVSVGSSGMWRRVVWQNDVMSTFPETQRLVPIYHSTVIFQKTVISVFNARRTSGRIIMQLIQSLILRTCIQHQIYF